jgi:hypothetical protein
MIRRDMRFDGSEDIETVRRLATDFMASYLLASPSNSQERDGTVPPLVEEPSGSRDAAVAVELLGDVAMAVWVACIEGQVVVQHVAAARCEGQWRVMAPKPN